MKICPSHCPEIIPGRANNTMKTKIYSTIEYLTYQPTLIEYVMVVYGNRRCNVRLVLTRGPLNPSSYNPVWIKDPPGVDNTKGAAMNTMAMLSFWWYNKRYRYSLQSESRLCPHPPTPTPTPHPHPTLSLRPYLAPVCHPMHSSMGWDHRHPPLRDSLQGPWHTWRGLYFRVCLQGPNRWGME